MHRIERYFNQAIVTRQKLEWRKRKFLVLEFMVFYLTAFLLMLSDASDRPWYPERIFFDSHSHTPLCKHAFGQPIAYAEKGLQRGLKGHIVTCHSPMPAGFSPHVRMSLAEFDQYVELVKCSHEAMEGRFEIRLGMESDWFPGMEQWVEKLHAMADFDFILGSVHPFLEEYETRFFRGDCFEFQKQYFQHLAESAESGLFDCLAHPDVVKSMTLREWRLDRLNDTFHEVLERIAKTGVAMELNTSGLHKAYPEMNPGNQLLRLMRRYRIPVVLGSDAHRPHRIAEDFEFALQALLKAGFDEVSVFEKRQRIPLRIADVQRSLKSEFVRVI